MSYGEYTDWVKAKEIYQERVKRAINSSNPIKSLDRIREDLQEAYDLTDYSNQQILEFYNNVKQLMLEQEVA
ncbi:hypothetical protein [Piscibacillus salipiscarius]|uniref:Uncharacterized protein n=1 Tax=Piscibacillus salipiscarius TaxID=299480 RepID=A0ABW5Q817_9BACI|nr:hypothetical protein [Piscibacillus salipiscarius]